MSVLKQGKILVTGGTGYIGSHTVVELQNNGYEVIIWITYPLPAGATDNYRFFDAKSAKHTQVFAGRVFKIKLAPYDVKVMDTKPF